MISMLSISLPYGIEFPIPIAFFGIAILMLTFFRIAKKSDGPQREMYGDYLAAEHKADFSRRKDLTPEDYLTVDTHKLPIREYPAEKAYARAAERQRNVTELAALPMVCNIASLNNRELKLKYGSANLDTIIVYEENYHQFIHNLMEWSTALIALGETADAIAVLETAIDHHCDRSQAFTMLADHLTDRGALAGLSEKAKTVLSGPALDRTLAHIEHRLGAIS